MTTKRDGSLNRLFFFFKDCLFFLLSGPSLFFFSGPSLFFFSGPSLFFSLQDRPSFSPSRTVPLFLLQGPSLFFGVAFVTFWGDGAYYVVYNQTKEDYV